MNYRHAYHAGNFADCVKHALLIALLTRLMRKETGLHITDTHAGIGTYDLIGEEAQKTGEWRDGIARVLGTAHPALAPFRDAVECLGLYPGSPRIIRHLLRPQDHLLACELHPEDNATLRRLFRNDPSVSVHHRDGYEAVRALLPPRNYRRGLVLIDPPFEKGDDFTRCAQAIAVLHTHFRAATVAVWYPIKHRAPTRAFHDALKEAGYPDLITAEFLLRPPLDPSRLNGCGVLVLNAPWGFADDAAAILKALAETLATGEDDIETRIDDLSTGATP